jgi:hypothetical protein
MNRNQFGLLLASLCLSAPVFASECALPPGAKAAEGMTTVAPEMAASPTPDPLCMPAEQALAKLRAPAPAAGAYVPLTKDDNTPWRFDMSQNGKRMTAAEFDAWMKAKGIRVATGKPTPAADQPASAPASATPPVQTGK